MPVSLETAQDRPNAKSVLRCTTAVLGGFIVLVGLTWLFLYLAFSPSLWKTVIGEARTPSGVELSIDRAHDGDISYEYFARVRGSGGKHMDWTYVGWSLDPTSKTETAVTKDSKFAGVEFTTTDGPTLVIYDTDEDTLSWISDIKGPDTLKFFRAWRQLYAQNPKLSEPP